MSRLEENKQIVEKISKIVNACPQLRFIQLLWALGIVDGQDRFYEESEITNKVMDINYKKLLGIKDGESNNQ